MVRRVLRVALLVILALWSVRADAQTAQISGEVTDGSGAVLPGVEVKATQVETGFVRSVITGGKGEYVLPSLPVGPYRIDATLDGFRTFTRTGVVLQVGANPVINVKLELGALQESVTVTAGAPLIETRNTGVGQVIDEKQIVNLPLNGRQPTQLVLLSGAAVINNTGGLVGSQRQYPSALAISVAGGTGNATSYLVDGGYNNDPLANLSQPLPFPDALQEFKVESGVRPARFGILPGATVNAVTKAGSNTLHGTGFAFIRDHSLNARNAFFTTDDGLKRQQYGGALGGPIVANKLFFFGGYQGTRVRVRPQDTTSFTPTADMLAGDFTQIASAACNNGTAVNLPSPFVGNRVDPSLFSPVALRLMKYLPTSTDPCGRVNFAVPDNNDEQQTIGRIDFQLTQRQRLFGRYYIANYDRKPGFEGTNILLGSGNGLGLDNRVQTAVIADDYTVTNSLLSSTRIAIARSRILRSQGASMPTFKDLGSQITPLVTDPGLAFFNLSVTNGFPGLGLPGQFNSTTYQLSQDFDWVKGSHQVAFGGQWVVPNFDGNGPFQADGIFTFNGQRAGGNRIGLADFLLGLPSQYRQGGVQDVKEHMHYVGIYAQDTWRVNDRFTLSAGLRWEPYFAAVEEAGYAANFSLDNFKNNVKSKTIPTAPAGLTFPGDPGFPGTQYNRNKLAQFAPRLGMVWDPVGDGRKTLRAAVGMFYESPKMWQYGRFPLNPPFGNTITINNPQSFTNPWATYAGGNPFPFTTTTFPQFGSFVNMPLDSPPMEMTQWNIAYQHQLADDWMVGATYLGNETRHMWLGAELNPAVYIPGASTVANTNTRRRLYLLNPTEGQYYADIPTTDPNGTGRYDGLILNMNRRLSHGWSTTHNLTWSKCENDGDPGIDITNFYPDPDNRSSNRGPCAADRRYIYNGSVIVQSPGWGSGASKLLSANWQLGTIIQARSGAPFTPSMTGDLALTGVNNQRPIVTGDPNSVATQSINSWFNTAAFTANTPGVWGSATRGMIRGSKYFNVDMALSRIFGLGAERKVEFRLEAFNVFNRFQPGDPVVNFNSANFGRIITAEDPRIMQVALKYLF